MKKIKPIACVLCCCVLAIFGIAQFSTLALRRENTQLFRTAENFYRVNRIHIIKGESTAILLADEHQNFSEIKNRLDPFTYGRITRVNPGDNQAFMAIRYYTDDAFLFEMTFFELPTTGEGSIEPMWGYAPFACGDANTFAMINRTFVTDAFDNNTCFALYLLIDNYKFHRYN